MVLLLMSFYCINISAVVIDIQHIHCSAEFGLAVIAKQSIQFQPKVKQLLLCIKTWVC